VAGLLGLPAVHRAVKPLVGPFRRAMGMLGTKPAETALIGDQIFTDIFGGNLCGLYTILVVPLQGKEFWGTRLFSRPLEKIVLARLKRYPEVLHGRWD
ncbi:MAG TPA: YqeG family HAD IIIA-type phosphatase, partial [Pelotomaculum sp.]|nr:YqeG family HAD IIIA-type phosphatase [Pelotomaculum sp.]